VPPKASGAGWYCLRAWREQGFKVTRGPAGCGSTPAWPTPPALPVRCGTCRRRLACTRRQRRTTRRRLVRAVRRGGPLMPVALLTHKSWPRETFLPELWPRMTWIKAPCIVHDAGILADVAA
jgi:hypothetical protein